MAANNEAESNEPIAGDAGKQEKRKSDSSTPRPTALAKKASKIVHRAETKTNLDEKKPEREGLLQRTKSVVKRAMSRRVETKNTGKVGG